MGNAAACVACYLTQTILCLFVLAAGWYAFEHGERGWAVAFGVGIFLLLFGWNCRYTILGR